MTSQTIKTGIPFWSILAKPKDEQQKLIDLVFQTPPSINSLLVSSKTGFFVKGLVKAYNLTDDSLVVIEFAILQVALGLKQMGELPVLFSSALKLANDKAQLLAQEIEGDLFSPIALDLNNFLTRKKTYSNSKALSGMAPSNTLDLKDSSNHTASKP